MRLVLLGAPGSGKGTQADILKEKLDLEKLSTGDLLRNEIKLNTPLGKKANEFMEGGNLVPDDIMIGILENIVHDFEEKGTGYILDGFPRTLPQAEALLDMLERQNAPLTTALLINASEEELIKRLCSRWTCRNCQGIFSYSGGLPNGEVCKNCGGELYQRPDDKKETIINRLKVYEELTQPLIRFFKDKELLKSVDGCGSIEEIYQRIEKILL